MTARVLCIGRSGQSMKTGIGDKTTLDAPLAGIVGDSPAMREVYRLTRLVGPTGASVLIVG